MCCQMARLESACRGPLSTMLWALLRSMNSVLQAGFHGDSFNIFYLCLSSSDSDPLSHIQL